MALPTNKSVYSAADALEALRVLGGNIRGQCSGWNTTMSAGSVDSWFVFAICQNIKSWIASIDTYSGTSGLNELATSELSGYQGTFTDDVAAVKTALQGCLTWISANTGSVSWFTIGTDGTVTPNSFTSTQTSGLRTKMSAVVSAISG